MRHGRPATWLAPILAALPLAGCVLGPDYARPPVPVHETWRDLPAATAESLANTPWWELFQDPVLQELIRTALVENRDLRIAVERIEEARARYGFTRSELWPQIDINATGGRFKLTEDGLIAPLIDGDTPFYVLTADVTWEIDLFGRIRRASEAEMSLLLATDQARRFTVLTLVSDVARAYVELRDFDRRLEIGRSTLESRRAYRELAKDRFEGGLTSELDFRQAEAEYHRTESFVHQFEMRVGQKENELSVLLGRPPGNILRGRPVEEVVTPPAVPAGLPSELLDRRPDIRQAEEELHAATANIGQAKALLFPRIALTGSYGWATTDLDALFSQTSNTWNLAANLLQPIFNAGRNRRRVEVTESQQRQTLYAYEQTILLAFQEVEDSLIGYRKSGEQRLSEGQRVGAERKVLDLAEMRYRGGVAAYLEVLDAQRSLFSSQLDEAQAIRDQLVSLIRLYKALGGGWPAEAETASAGAAGTPTPQVP
ncbi:MAG: efflux transporter outer membrane subunit [Candidatus Polarisedimenticolia bacterium]